jgi:hypothetical protein
VIVKQKYGLIASYHQEESATIGLFQQISGFQHLLIPFQVIFKKHFKIPI